MIDTIASHILALPAWVALLLVFLMPALESSAFVGFIFPGEIALILGGVLAFEGRVSLVAVLAAGIIGAIAGDSVGYLVGRRYGRGLLDGTLGRWVNQRHLDQAERYLAERGGKAVFLGRFTAALRVMIPGLAGMSRMRYRRFIAYNIAGGAAWATMCVVLGYIGGSSWRHVEHLASRVGLGALAVLVLAFAGGYVLRRTRSDWGQRQLDRLRASRTAARVGDRFPRQVAWVSARLDPSSRTGLPMTAAVAVALAALWGFLGITQDVLAREELALLDPRIHAWVLDHRTTWLSPLMQAVTWLGANAVVLPLLVTAAIVLRRTRRCWRPVWDIIVVYGTAVVAHAMVAVLVHRQRPSDIDWLTTGTGWAYPSGHTMQATVGYGILFVLLAPRRSPRMRALMACAGASVVLLVAASRLYLGVHWLTDVLGSVSLGVAVLAIWGIARLTLPTAGTDDAGDQPATQ